MAYIISGITSDQSKNDEAHTAYRGIQIEAQELLVQITSRNFQSTLPPCTFELANVIAYWQELPVDISNRILENFNLHNTAELTEHLVQMQLEDGSWREDSRLLIEGDITLPEALVTTVTALRAVTALGAQDIEAVSKGVQFLSKNFHKLFEISENPKKPIGFEAVFIEGLIDLMNKGIVLDVDNYQTKMEMLSQVKSIKLQQKLKDISTRHSTLHSVLDGLGDADNVDWGQITQFQSPNGSMGIYLSSTLALLRRLPPDHQSREKASAYINEQLDLEQGPVSFYPADEFERWWALAAIGDSPLRGIIGKDDNLPLQSHLERPVPDAGISVSDEFLLPDVDTTAMKIIAQANMGIEIQSLSPIYNFFSELDGAFRCYPHENRVSISATVHALRAMWDAARNNQHLIDGQFTSTFNKVLQSIFDILEISADGGLPDKWHLSNLYSTCHFVELLAEIKLEEARKGELSKSVNFRNKELINDKSRLLLEYIFSKSKPVSGFGELSDPTVEETGYAIRAIVKAKRSDLIELDAEKMEMVFAAGLYLQTNTGENDLPLWIGKTAYKSQSITTANRLSALAMMNELN